MMEGTEIGTMQALLKPGNEDTFMGIATEAYETFSKATLEDEESEGEGAQVGGNLGLPSTAASGSGSQAPPPPPPDQPMKTEEAHAAGTADAEMAAVDAREVNVWAQMLEPSNVQPVISPATPPVSAATTVVQHADGIPPPQPAEPLEGWVQQAEPPPPPPRQPPMGRYGSDEYPSLPKPARVPRTKHEGDLIARAAACTVPQTNPAPAGHCDGPV